MALSARYGQATSESIEAAKRAACEAIQINLEAHQEAGQAVPDGQAVLRHLENPEFRDLLLILVEVPGPKQSVAT